MLSGSGPLAQLRRRPAFVIVAVVAAVAVVIATTRILGVWGGQAARTTDFDAAIEALRDESSIPVQVSIVDGAAVAVVARIPTEGSDAAERARDYLDDHDAIYPVAPGSALAPVRTTASGAEGALAVVFRQSIDGVPVHGAELTVPILGTDALGSTGRILAEADIDVTPSIDAAVATQAASADNEVARVVGEPSLVVWDPSLFGLGPSAPVLAWRVELAGAIHEQVFVDASTGAVVQRLELSPSAFDLELLSGRGETSAADSTCFLAPPGTVLGDEAGVDPGSVEDAEAVVAYEEARATHEWFLARFGRDSFDGQGATLRVVIHARFEGLDGLAIGNAHWVGGPCGVLEFSNGFVAGDVVTHEFVHAVVEHTAGLEYVWQSGALNESYADVFAFLRTGDPTMGEDLPGGAIRDLAEPSRFDHPDRMSELRRPAYAKGRLIDAGWVHWNSGIPNHAAFLMARGGTHPETGISVTGLGDELTADIYFASLAFLNAASDFTQHRAALEQAAIALDLDAAEVCSVRNALAAVELGVGDADCDGALDAGDRDGDSVIDRLDNCPEVANADQADADRDGIGNPCDDDPNSLPTDETAIRILHLWAPPEGDPPAMLLVPGQDEAALTEVDYGTLGEWVIVPTDPVRGVPEQLFVAPADEPSELASYEGAELDFGDRVTIVVWGFGTFRELQARAIWERGEMDPMEVSWGHGPPWPAAIAGEGQILVYPKAIHPLSREGLDEWFYGVDGSCLTDLATGEIVDEAIGGTRDVIFAALDPGRHELTASATACDGEPGFPAATFDLSAGDRIVLLPFGTGVDDLAFFVLPVAVE